MSGDEREIRVLTWNVGGLDESQLGERMERICLEIVVGGDLARAASGAPTPPMPHVVALQEIVRVAHRACFGPHLSAAGYALWPETPPTDREHYELVAVRTPWTIERAERRPFAESPLAREALIATVRHRVHGGALTMITGHLESLRNGRDARLAQAREIAGWMRAESAPAVFAGDTNLRDSEWQDIAGELGVRDAFEELGSPRSVRVTWRPEGETRRGFRFDRVWLAGAISARALRLRRCPGSSDHEGVEALLRLGSER